ncbi:hypothetical protein GYMLUDRAFT_62584 [Collybiopsis luxurians FD-317 M1]|uniref:Uncharacterized protein n=1 Tax=Collybiopsis luxurians FD-317 M1 TaxID=944289 RepID=A0A0D0CJS6_9AGAR|nr:hypothetical protein GYMLUDRAFT_62584 [Collybiopsis luxurians FD-317 M1]
MYFSLSGAIGNSIFAMNVECSNIAESGPGPDIAVQLHIAEAATLFTEAMVTFNGAVGGVKAIAGFDNNESSVVENVNTICTDVEEICKAQMEADAEAFNVDLVEGQLGKLVWVEHDIEHMCDEGRRYGLDSFCMGCKEMQGPGKLLTIKYSVFALMLSLLCSKCDRNRTKLSAYERRRYYLAYLKDFHGSVCIWFQFNIVTKGNSVEIVCRFVFLGIGLSES